MPAHPDFERLYLKPLVRLVGLARGRGVYTSVPSDRASFSGVLTFARALQVAKDDSAVELLIVGDTRGAALFLNMAEGLRPHFEGGGIRITGAKDRPDAPFYYLGNMIELFTDAYLKANPQEPAK